jgi:type III secretion protein HrpB1
MPTVLAFRTPVGALPIPVGPSKLVGTVDVSRFRSIRLVADERTGGGSAVIVRMTITEGSELVAQLDTVTLTPRSQLTRVYEVPGVKLSIYADALPLPGGSTDAIDVLIYGSD